MRLSAFWGIEGCIWIRIGEMQMSEAKGKATAFDAIELLGIAGFAFFFGWMLVTFYWLFTVFVQDFSLADRDFVQLFIFLGVSCGYLLCYLMGRYAKRSIFEPAMFVIEAVFGCCVAASSVALLVGAEPPLPLLCAANLLAGISAGMMTVAWLDTCGRMPSKNYSRFISLSFLVGSLLFVIDALMPAQFQPGFCVVYLLMSVGLLYFTSRSSEAKSDIAEDAIVAVKWKFSKEVEPSLIAFGVVFGLTFVFLFNYGSTYVLIGLLAVIPGSMIPLGLSLSGKFLNITVLQRVLLCVTVLSCICIPFANAPVQLGCAFLVVASWALFMPTNYAHLVRKSIELGGARVFRQVPIRLFVASFGYLLGWGVATAITVVFGAHSEAFTVTRLATAFLVVLLVMIFFPNGKHHMETSDLDGMGAADKTTTVSTNMSESELFERKCNAVADMYQLSPRETDILKFLAKGRNAAYIQGKLTISSHTVKSHIYSIYRKVDIHSQQSLMDFVEDYPIDR